MKLNPPTLSPEDFVKHWQNAALTERASYQQHFLEVCHLVGAPTPIERDDTGEDYTFEYGLKKTSGKQGYADVFNRGHFAIEYKQKGKDLDAAYIQLQQYRENLNNPPLLIVCDLEHWRIHTNFTNTPPTVIEFRHEDLLKTHTLSVLRRIFSDPASFHPEKNKLEITEEVAAQFKNVVDNTVGWENDPEHVARFMTKLVFCMFVEDIGLLPKRAYDGILTEIIRATVLKRDLFPRYVRELFEAMATGGNVQMVEIPWFNGSMFEVGEGEIVPLGGEALNALDKASDRDWAHVEPTIFGTIFERTLDQKKRAQLGAHYTSPADILLIVEPVLMQPLRRAWAAVQAEAAPLRAIYLSAPNPAQQQAAAEPLRALRARILQQVRTIKVLDPACGSGNFLYISLRLLLDLEKEIITHPFWAGLPAETIGVHPTQLYGIEVNEIAHALASVVVWIGYLQWRYDNGFFDNSQPILTKMSDNIVHRDAILRYDAAGKPTEPDWPAVDVIVGNPPFLGGKKQRTQLGDKYLNDLFALYQGRVPHEADLVTYWFERARTQIEAGKVKRAGLLATNSIRGGANREVLNRIKDTGEIFMAWADREWVLDGAAVRVSMVGFDKGDETLRLLDGNAVESINSDLSGLVDITKANRLTDNANMAFMGDTKGGSFDISDETANEMLSASNSSGVNNADVVRRWVNGLDITRSNRMMWIIDFGIDMALEKAELYTKPFKHVQEKVLPLRQQNRRQAYQDRWWIHVEARPSMREKIAELSRYIATPTVAKHRLFVWLDPSVIPDHQLIAVAREDDYFFGVLHSYLHELWALRMGTWIGKGNDPRYTPTSTFETFPFPFVPGQEDFNDARVQAISAAAQALHEERHVWLNPPDNPPDLKDRTLTNLYNALQMYRSRFQPGNGEMTQLATGNGTELATGARIKAAAAQFAPRLHELHRALDLAVVAAYGWDAPLLSDDEAILRSLLSLNQAKTARS